MTNFYRRLLMVLPVFLISISASLAQTNEQKALITENYNLNTLNTLSQQYAKKALLEKQNAIELAKANGWEVLKSNDDGSFDELIRISAEGTPIYYTVDNVAAAKSTRANHVNSGGNLGLSLDGQNMTAHVWDGGPTRTTHQEFDGAGGNNRVSINDGVTALNGNSFHAQHVTGTIVASGFVAAAKGMAPQAKAKTHDWNNDLAEATTEAANGMLVSNHSYGFRASLVPDYYFGAYIEDSRDWDNLMYNSPFYLMVVAGGNDGNDNSSNASPLNGSSAFDKLTGHSTSKNNMVVANGQDANITAAGVLTSVTINSGSSEGPTDDLRIKPDITGNGTNVYSTYDNSDAAYNSISGTSMASPNVAGSLLLLQQHANNVNGSFMRSATLKGVTLHTADDAGISGPDAVYGWGLMNTRVAAQVISQNGNESLIDERSLTSGQSYTVNVDSDGSSPLMASISWTDPAGTVNTGTVNLTTPVLVNDLDIRVTKSSSTFTPYKLTGVNANTQGDNNVDPYERVDIASASGTYTITVTHKGSLSSGSQDFSLIVTGLTGTPVVCNATTPSGLAASGVSSSSANLNWNAVTGTTYDVRYRATGTTTWTTSAVAGTSTALSGLSASTQYEAQVRSKCPSGNSSYSSSVTFTTTIVQINYCASNGNSVADEYIGRVQLGSINNTTGAASSGYADFTSQSTDLAKGSNATITVTPAWTGTVYAEGYSVWIDYNRDGDFTDSGEQVWTRAASNTTPVSGSFTVPAGTSEGTTRMRVSMKYNGIPTSCESFPYGEVEDYTVNITGGSTGGGGCTSGGISSFPYSESFESGIGVWSQATGDDGDWVRDSNGTPSSTTGPSNAANGSFYMFLEASTNNSAGQIGSNATAILESPCVDLSGTSTANISFNYHMYGTNMGTARLEVSTNDGGTWTSLWSETGNKGNSWLSASASLNSYAGSTVKLRFRGTTGNGWRSDLAIDNVSITTNGTTSTNSYVVTNEPATEVFEVSIYPNPVSGSILNIKSTQANIAFSIVSMTGQQINRGTVENDQVDISKLSAGMYMIQLVSGTELKSIRFLKN